MGPAPRPSAHQRPQRKQLRVLDTPTSSPRRRPGPLRAAAVRRFRVVTHGVVLRSAVRLALRLPGGGVGAYGYAHDAAPAAAGGPRWRRPQRSPLRRPYQCRSTGGCCCRRRHLLRQSARRSPRRPADAPHALSLHGCEEPLLVTAGLRGGEPGCHARQQQALKGLDSDPVPDALGGHASASCRTSKRDHWAPFRTVRDVPRASVSNLFQGCLGCLGCLEYQGC